MRPEKSYFRTSQKFGVIIGRNADYIPKDRDDVLNVFIHGNMQKNTERSFAYIM